MLFAAADDACASIEVDAGIGADAWSVTTVSFAGYASVSQALGSVRCVTKMGLALSSVSGCGEVGSFVVG